MKALSVTQDASKLLSADGVQDYLRQHGVPESHRKELRLHEIDGLAFCFLTDKDLHEMNVTCVGQRKRILFASSQYRKLVGNKFNTEIVENPEYQNKRRCENGFEAMNISGLWCSSHTDDKNTQGDFSVFHRNFTPANTRQKKLVETNPKPWKVVISALYLFLVAGITSFVMVIAHERLPDISKYPPLPDLFLDNLPYIGWAFEAAEWVGVILGIVWVTILLFHRYRSILLRRFFAISGTVFLLRSITMVITSLSVPGQHLAEQCSPYAFKNNTARFNRFLEIWFGMGMSIRGIQTCGDYMFSGHTTMLTLLNFFITEYSPHNIQAIHTFSWVLNLFGVFFILASHEHYSIDVFVAVYVSSRLFLYYHCLANSRILCQEDKNRAMIWFPLFTLFEYDVCGIVPNEYELPFQSLWSNFRTHSSDSHPIHFAHVYASDQPEKVEAVCNHLKVQ